MDGGMKRDGQSMGEGVMMELMEEGQLMEEDCGGGMMGSRLREDG